jgi:methyl-accepting chemotaxis protein
MTFPTLRLGIAQRLSLLGAVIIALAVTASVWQSFRMVETSMNERAQARLDVNIKLLRTTLADLGPARRDGEKLYFGPMLANGDVAVVDRVKEIAGGVATIFAGDMRVATNVTKPDGTRAMSMRLAAGPAYDTVLRTGKTYRGEADILGRTYLTVYEPILADGAVIGILFVGVVRAEFLSVLDTILNQNLLAGLVAVAVGALILFLVVRRTLKPLDGLRREMAAISAQTIAQDRETQAQSALERNLDQLRQSLHALGEPRQVGGQLVFGTTPVTDAIADGIQAKTGGINAIFLGEGCVASAMIGAGGKRATGTNLTTPAARETVLVEGRTYHGEADIFGTRYRAIYEPIVAGGRNIGILFVGVAKADEEARDVATAAVAADEIGQMAQAVAVIRNAVAAKAATDAEALAARRSAEEERRREAAGRHAAATSQRDVVQALSNALERLSAGDLTYRVEADFPADYRALKDNYNATSAELGTTIEGVSEVATAMMRGIEAIAQTADDLSRRTEQQAAAIEETAASLDEVTVTVARTATGAK